MKVFGNGPAPRAERYATALLHDDARARVVGFRLEPGQAVPPHTSEAMVLVLVTHGAARFSGRDTEVRLAAGEGAAYEPGEVHGIIADTEPVRFLAVIAPRQEG